MFFDFGSGVNKTSKDEQALQEEIAAMREQIVSETNLVQSLRGGDPEITQAMARNTITKGCSICKEKFIKVWNDAEEEWSYKNAVVVDNLVIYFLSRIACLQRPHVQLFNRCFFSFL